jgi:hypothetical protein
LKYPWHLAFLEFDWSKYALNGSEQECDGSKKIFMPLAGEDDSRATVWNLHGIGNHNQFTPRTLLAPLLSLGQGAK